MVVSAESNISRPVILIIGKNGQVGWELQRTLSHIGRIVCCDRNDLDLSNGDLIRKIIRQMKPDVVVNAAAYTAVDKAEDEVELAARINAIAPGILAEEAARIGALLVHYSTDYVFDGTKADAYSESDQPNPVNVYGKTKLAGEQAIQDAAVDHLIFRTSWVYASRGHNFLNSILRLAREREELNIVADQIGAPTWARLIAEVTSLAVWQSLSARSRDCFESGLYHLVSAGETSWYGFTSEIIEVAKDIFPAGEFKVSSINPIATDDYPTPAQRPANSRLAVSRLEKKFDLVMPSWRQPLQLCIREMV